MNKQELIQAFKDKGFSSRIIGKSVHAEHTNKDFYYLWMCEALNWLRKEYNIHIITKPFHNSLLNSTTVVSDVIDIKTGKVIKSPKKENPNDALEYALTQSLTFI